MASPGFPHNLRLGCFLEESRASSRDRWSCEWPEMPPSVIFWAVKWLTELRFWSSIMAGRPCGWLEDQWVYQILESGFASGVAGHVASSFLVSRKPGMEEVNMPSVVDRLVWYVNMDNTDSETPPQPGGRVTTSISLLIRKGCEVRSADKAAADPDLPLYFLPILKLTHPFKQELSSRRKRDFCSILRS